MPMGESESFVPPPPTDVVSKQENQELIQVVLDDEVRRVVWLFAKDKAPRPDGFPPLFIKWYWPII